MKSVKEIFDNEIGLIIKVNDKDIEDSKRAEKLSKQIMLVAHSNQFRINGELYANHPLRCLRNYMDFIKDKKSRKTSLKDKIWSLNYYDIPYFGVKEVCLLHDVIEDNHMSLEEMDKIFKEENLFDYYSLYIRKPLDLITHKKEDSYEKYIEKCMEHPVSALCKMMDLKDNMNPLTLTKLEEKECNKITNYLNYIYIINSKYKFIENAYLFNGGDGIYECN